MNSDLEGGLMLKTFALLLCGQCIAQGRNYVMLFAVNRRKAMAKTANLYARIEPKLKHEAETILGGLGVPVSNAINMFYRQIVIHRGLPFAVQFPARQLPNAAMMGDAELDAEVSRGFADIAAGRKRPLKEVADDLAQEFSL